MNGGNLRAPVMRARNPWRVTLLAALSGLATFALLIGAPAAGAKPLQKPHKSNWASYTLPDENGDPATVSLRVDPTRPIMDVVLADGTARTVRLVRMYEANSDTLEPYEGSEINLLDQRWSLFGPAVGTSWFPCSDGTDEYPEHVNFTYRGRSRPDRYDRIGLNFHLAATGVYFKFDFCVTNYRWVSTDPTADLVIDWQVFPTGTKPAGVERLVYSHFEGDLFHDPPLIP